MKSSQAAALTALVAVTAVWGWTFLLVKNAVAAAPVMDFLAARFVLAAVAMIVIRPTCLRNMTRRGLLRAAALGLALGAGYLLQTYGLLTASATVSGFITGMFVIFTPLVSWVLLRHRTGRTIWVAVALSVAGLALIGLRGWSIGTGELLTLGCALCYAIHIVGLGAWAWQHESYGFAFVQVATAGLIFVLAAVPHGISLPLQAEVWGAITITGIFATAVAFVVQTWAQSLVSPTHAAVVMTMEPVFAGFFAVVFGAELLTPRIVGGAALVLTAMLVVQLRRGESAPFRQTVTARPPADARPG